MDRPRVAAGRLQSVLPIAGRKHRVSKALRQKLADIAADDDFVFRQQNSLRARYRRRFGWALGLHRAIFHRREQDLER